MKLTYEELKGIMEVSTKPALELASWILGNMATAEIDKIPTVKVTPEEKKVLDNYCTVIDVSYPNEKGMVSIYFIGLSFLRIV